MNIVRLDLLAYGPFDKQSLEFGDNGGLHIVYGPNEAGKSSALRALRGLLFGIEERTDDDFRHENKLLRIGATLANGQAKRLQCVRRKGRKDTLRDGDDDKPIDPALLQKLLGGVTAELFATMFGICHDTLVAGGREISQGKGDIGSSLFAAAGGLSRLQAVQRTLESEADALFTPRASTKTINQQLSELDKTRKEIKKLQLTPQEWSEHDKAYHEALAQRDAAERQLKDLHVEKSRLERFRDALPAVTQRAETITKLQPLAGARVLRPTFTADRVAARKSRDLAEESAAAERAELLTLDQQLAELSPPQTLLNQSAAIDGLYRQLTEYASALRDRPELILQRTQHESQAAEALRRLGRDLSDGADDKLRLTDPQRARIDELAQRHGALDQSVKESTKRADQLRLELKQIEQQQSALAPPRDVEPLRRLLRRADQQGDLAGELATAEETLRRQETESTAAFKRLGLWSGSPDELLTAAFPSEETILRYQEELAERQRELKQLENERAEEQKRIDQLQSQIDQLQTAGAVPTEEDLRQARAKRDDGWRLVLSAWKKNNHDLAAEAAFVKSCPGAADLPAAYEITARQADDLADRLRREADRVQNHARAVADHRQHELQLARLVERSEQAAAQLAADQSSWANLWRPLAMEPLPPREMIAWLRKQQQWAADCRQLHASRESVVGLRAKMEELQALLISALRAANERPDESSLAALAGQATVVCEAAEELEEQRSQLQRDLLRVKAGLEEAAAALAQAQRERGEWLEAWGREIGRLGLAKDASPAQARKVMERLDEWSKSLDDAAKLAPRIAQIDEFCKRFTRESQALTAVVAPDLATSTPEMAIAELSARLKQAQSQRQRRSELQERRQKAADDLAKVERTIREKDRLLTQLCEEAGCELPDELAAAEDRSQLRARLQGELDGLEKQLAELARGEPMGQFLAAAAAWQSDQLDAELVGLQARIDDAVKEKESATERYVTERNWLQAHDGAAQAAEENERAQGLLAALTSDVQQYARVRLASIVLRKAIEHYREKNQDPVLARASETFAELTGGAFLGLKADTDESGEQVLLGVRASPREEVPIKNMSDGTADQLYLALRLASLERYVAEHDNDAPPFIVDDILIRFDDDRSVQTLKALARLATRMQVIFFTHHQHLLRMAEEHLPPGAWTAHELNSRQAAVVV